MKINWPVVLLLALIASGLAWFAVHAYVESGLASTAVRGLSAIIDLVATDLETRAAPSPPRKGLDLARAATGSQSRLAPALERIRDEQLRSVYFFDSAGQVVPGSGGPVAGAAGNAVATPEIVSGALKARQLDDRPLAGAQTDPYPDRDGNSVIGAWRWLPNAELGIVVERPYAPWARPLRWIDGLFAALLVLLAFGALLTGIPSIRNLRSDFRRPELRRCGPYMIERLLGEGAMANVYLARHRHLGRKVALKLLKGGRQSDELAERFDREAKLGSRLSHPNIVGVFEHGSAPGGGFYYTMEYIHGVTLPQWVQEHGPLVPARAVRILQQVCAAVGAMHRAGLLHRDIKPDNVMAYATGDDHDLVKLIDFGLIRKIESGQTRDLTRNLRVLGTPAFMAPERLLDPRSIDPRTDLYGIGCIAFYVLTGRRPF
ncbi:MAG: serine/threonine-protein kinase, partial [Betaproteobacteria bacterium]